MSQLFPVDLQPPDEPKLSPDQRRTRRRNALLEAGLHPLWFEPAHPELGTCGDCAHCYRDAGHAGHYIKCRLRHTFGAATDIRMKWPACRRFQARGTS